MSDYSWIGPLVGAIGKGINSYGANNAMTAEYQGAFDKMLQELQARFGEYNSLGKAGYKDIAPQTLGPSALEGIQTDPAARQAELEAMAALSDLSAKGGLSLGDMTALNEIEGNLNRNTMARQKGLENQFAARGQLGSGAQLAMALANQQNAAMNANQRAESIAAQAQDRAMRAILEKGRLGRSMSDADYARKAEAARARDAIEARNAAARTDAAKTNNAYAGQAFQDELNKMAGKTSLTNSMNQAVFGKGKAAATNIGANAMNTNSLLDAGSKAWGSWSEEQAKKNNETPPPTDPYDPGYSEDDEINQNDDD